MTRDEIEFLAMLGLHTDARPNLAQQLAQMEDAAADTEFGAESEATSTDSNAGDCE